MINSRNLSLLFCLILQLFSISQSRGEPRSNILQPIGLYQHVEGDDGEHAYGHRIILWHSGTQLIGQLTMWDANIEGQSGDFSDGSFDPKSGAIKFRVTVEKGYLNPIEHLTGTFSGNLSGELLTGSLKWEGEESKFFGEGGVEQLKLPKDNEVSLREFKDLKSWLASPYDRFDDIKAEPK